MPRTKNTLLAVYCKQCKKEFRVSNYRRDTVRYCSRQCQTQFAIDHAPERFWSQVDMSGGPDACWPWTGLVSPSGYGRIKIQTPQGKRSLRTNRYAAELMYGPIPDGMFACHTCDNPVCCNPAHLFIGTPADNTRDGIKKGRIVGKMNPDTVREVRRLYAAGDTTYQALANHFGCGMETIRDVIKRYTWKDIY